METSERVIRGRETLGTRYYSGLIRWILKITPSILCLQHRSWPVLFSLSFPTSSSFFFFFAGLEGWFLRVDLTFLSFVPAPCIKSYKGICREYWKIWRVRGVGRDEKLAERIQCECFNSGTCKLDFRIGFSDL